MNWYNESSINGTDSAEGLFQAIVQKNGWRMDRRGEVHVKCPDCDKETKPGHVHFSFSIRGGKCLVCGWSASLSRLAREFGVTHSDRFISAYTPPVAEPKKISRWRSNPGSLVSSYLEAPDRVSQWQSYKQLLTMEAISRWQLGIGVLPASRCKHRRLIIPGRNQRGEIVTLRGRLIKNSCDCAQRRANNQPIVCMEGCSCDKWLTAGSSETILFNADRIVPGITKIIIVCENMIDTVITMEMGMSGEWANMPWASTVDDEPVVLGDGPVVVPVCSTAGAAHWNDEWTTWFRELELSVVIVWYDNDYPGGLPNRRTRQKMLAERRRSNPKQSRFPLANGEKLIERLNQGGVPVVGYQWPDWAAPHMDIGELLWQQHILNTLEA